MNTIADFTKLTRTQKKALLRKHRGLLSRAAEAAGVTRGQASRVFWGYVQQSPNVAQAINREIANANSTDRTITGGDSVASRD